MIIIININGHDLRLDPEYFIYYILKYMYSTALSHVSECFLYCKFIEFFIFLRKRKNFNVKFSTNKTSSNTCLIDNFFYKAYIRQVLFSDVVAKRHILIINLNLNTYTHFKKMQVLNENFTRLCIKIFNSHLMLINFISLLIFYQFIKQMFRYLLKNNIFC